MFNGSKPIEDIVILNGKYLKETDIFCIGKRYGEYFYETHYDTFDDFYHAMNEDLSLADLFEYDFNGINLSDYNLGGATLISEIEIKAGIYKDLTYKKYKCKLESSKPRKDNTNQFERPDETKLHSTEAILDGSWTGYISDLNLDYRLQDAYPNHFNKTELDNFLDNVISQVVNNSKRLNYHDKLFIIGNTCSNKELFKRFLSHINMYTFNESSPFLILGDYEFENRKSDESFKDVVEEYTFLCKKRSIRVLENIVFIPKSKNIFYKYDEIINLTNDEIINLFRETNYGYVAGSAYATEKNKTNHEILSMLHNKLKEAVPNKKVYVITYRPFKEWLDGDINPNWVYINGSTLSNGYEVNCNIHHYYDNQSILDDEIKGFKLLHDSNLVDIFDDYKEGVYKITSHEYGAFYRCLGHPFSFSREFKTIYMLKNHGLYSFLAVSHNGTLNTMDCGLIKNADYDDVAYYFDKLSTYGQSLKLFMDDLYKYLEDISIYVRSFGGIGVINGSIVDIDGYNHIYIDPITRKAQIFFSRRKTEKLVFRNLISMLGYVHKTFAEKFKIIDRPTNLPSNLIDADNMSLYFYKDEDCSCFTISDLIKSLKCVHKMNVIKTWNDIVVDSVSYENGVKIVQELIKDKLLEKK